MPPVTNLTQRLRSRARLTYSLAALAGVVAFGTVGFSLIEGWSPLDALYMTVMTVTTVGYGPPLPLSPAGRNFAIFFMVLGVGTAGYLLSTAVQSLVRSDGYNNDRHPRLFALDTDYGFVYGGRRAQAAATPACGHRRP